MNLYFVPLVSPVTSLVDFKGTPGITVIGATGGLGGVYVISYFDIARVVVGDGRVIFIVAFFDPAVAVIVTVGAGKVVVVATVGAGKVGVTGDDSVETEDVPSV